MARVALLFLPHLSQALVLVFCGLTAILQAFLWETPALLPGALPFAALAVLTKTEVVSLVMGGLFIIEALSVIIQVVSYKAN